MGLDILRAFNRLVSSIQNRYQALEPARQYHYRLHAVHKLYRFQVTLSLIDHPMVLGWVQLGTWKVTDRTQ